MWSWRLSAKCDLLLVNTMIIISCWSHLLKSKESKGWYICLGTTTKTWSRRLSSQPPPSLRFPTQTISHLLLTFLIITTIIVSTTTIRTAIQVTEGMEGEFSCQARNLAGLGTKCDVKVWVLVSERNNKIWVSEIVVFILSNYHPSSLLIFGWYRELVWKSHPKSHL